MSWSILSSGWFFSVHHFLPTPIWPPPSTLNVENNFLTWWFQRINWPFWSARWLWWDCGKWVFQVIPVWHFADPITPLAEFWRSSLLSEKEFCYADAQDSHGVYDVRLGLNPYLRNGGRSRVEIKEEFHEVVVPLSALLALYWYHGALYHLSVQCISYLPILTFWLAQMGQTLGETGCRRISYVNGGS